MSEIKLGNSDRADKTTSESEMISVVSISKWRKPPLKVQQWFKRLANLKMKMRRAVGRLGHYWNELLIEQFDLE